MAARLNKYHANDIRQKIQAAVIVDRLHKHFMGELEMSKTQLRAAEVLLERSVPKLSQIQHTGEDGEQLKVLVEFISARNTGSVT